jgi:protein-tyrosine-phosphatase
MRILIVCTGNILRSVMAEYLLRSELPHIYVESAGYPCKRHGQNPYRQFAKRAERLPRTSEKTPG